MPADGSPAADSIRSTPDTVSSQPAEQGLNRAQAEIRDPAWRRAARWLRHLPDRALHPLRRRRAARSSRDALRAAHSGTPDVLFVCHGNICRSPYAALAFEQDTRRRGVAVRVTSAGFINPYQPCPAEALSVASRRGDLSAHRSSLVTPERVQDADLVVVMSAAQARSIRRRNPEARVLVLGDLDPLPIDRRTVRDPIGQSESIFEEVYARIDRCIESLVEALD